MCSRTHDLSFFLVSVYISLLFHYCIPATHRSHVIIQCIHSLSNLLIHYVWNVLQLKDLVNNQMQWRAECILCCNQGKLSQGRKEYNIPVLKICMKDAWETVEEQRERERGEKNSSIEATVGTLPSFNNVLRALSGTVGSYVGVMCVLQYCSLRLCTHCRICTTSILQ